MNHSNLSSVWTPLLHAVYKFDPKSRDQVRMSLTRSYKAPGIGSLLARPQINAAYTNTSQTTFLGHNSFDFAVRPEDDNTTEAGTDGK